jgi:hypothetical protein
MPQKRRFSQEPHGVTFQKTSFFLVTAVKTSNLTNFYLTFVLIFLSQFVCYANKRIHFITTLFALVYRITVCVCVCVCVRARARRSFETSRNTPLPRSSLRRPVETSILSVRKGANLKLGQRPPQSAS